MKKLIESIKYWGQLLLLPIYWFSFFIQRDKKIWLFGSTFGRRFADNPRYLYLYLSQHRREFNNIHPIWISHDKRIVRFLKKQNYEAYYYLSLKGIWVSLRGKVYIFDNYSKDINFWTSGGAVKVNLWHGVGNKQINYDNKHDPVRHPKTIWEKIKYFPRSLSDEKISHYILATSPLMAKIFARAFRVPRNHVIVAGYPRNDMLFEQHKIHPINTKEEKKLLQLLKHYKQDGVKLVGYFPTFRDSELTLLQVMDFKQFDTFLATQNMICIIKLHPKSKLKNTINQLFYPQIHVISSEIDSYSFLKEVDVLVTDYSSIYSDFMLLDRPTIAFQYDYKDYSTHTREAYFKFEQYMPEVKATTMKELMNGLQCVIKEDLCKEARKRSRDRLFKQKHAGACREVAEKINQLL